MKGYKTAGTDWKKRWIKMGAAATLLIPCFSLHTVFLSCKTREPADPPIITSATYQHTLYNGQRQPVEVKAAKADAPPFIVTYFLSEESLEKNEGGVKEAPAEVGDYYVRIERPAGNGYRAGGNITVEYHIQKAMITITAGEVQTFRYDGSPKEAQVETVPPAGFTVAYYAGDAALDAPPSEKGRYRGLITFPGNAHYMSASKEIELVIE